MQEQSANTQDQSQKQEKQLINLIGMSLADLENSMIDMGEKKFRGKQIYGWIYQKGARSIDEMSNISKPLREELKKIFRITRPILVKEQTSVDGTRKWLLRMEDGNEIETVYIPQAEGKNAICISSQIGCTLTCKFCHTGTQLLVRNLEVHELIGQFMIARDSFNDWPSSDPERILTNIVVMGMGEPLYNYDNMKKAIEIFTDGSALAISRRRVTLSTSGVVPEMKKMSVEMGCQLAISLHAPNDEIRNQIMPINKKYPLKELVEVLENFPNKNARRITVEYILIKDLNDQEKHADELVKLLKNVYCKFNLIPYNPWDSCPNNYQPPSRNAVMRFAKRLNTHGAIATIRESRGDDIMAACGQLRSQSQRVPLYKQREQTQSNNKNENTK